MVRHLQLGLRNVIRQRRRTAAALMAIAIGVACIILVGGFVRDIFEQLAEAIIHSETGHIQVARQGYFAYGSRSPEKFVIEEPGPVEALIRAQPSVSGVLGRLKFTGLLGNGRSDLAVVAEGVEPQLEAALGTYVNVLQGRRLRDNDKFGAMIGAGVAQSLKIGVGAPVSLVVSSAGGAMNAIDLEIVAVVQSFSREYDARSVKVPLSAAQNAMATRGINTLVVSVSNTAEAASVANALRASLTTRGLEVRLWSEVNDFYDKAVELYRRQFGVLQLIILLMVLLSVVNSVSGVIYERTAEFGTMRAVGNRNRDVITLIVAEGTALGVVGSAIGVVVGLLLATAISIIGIPMPPPPNSDLPYVARIQVDPVLVSQAAIIGILASALGSVPAAFRVGRISIVDALRNANA